MTLVDTSVMVATIVRSDANHSRCVAALGERSPSDLATTWPCVTEAMHLVRRAGGHAGQSLLWDFLALSETHLYELDPVDVARMRTLMAKYRDLPMDLADASLVAAAERLGSRTVFTLDSDFRVYRLDDGSALDVTP